MPLLWCSGYILGMLWRRRGSAQTGFVGPWVVCVYLDIYYRFCRLTHSSRDLNRIQDGNTEQTYQIYLNDLKQVKIAACDLPGDLETETDMTQLACASRDTGQCLSLHCTEQRTEHGVSTQY